MRKMQDPVRINIAAKVVRAATNSNAPSAQGAPSGVPMAAQPSGQAAAESFNSQQSGAANVIKAK